jgi:hypothetical protein
MALEPGILDSSDNFVNSDCMAKYIEDALPPPPDPELGKHDRRQFLIAISTGIINYLKAHDHDSFSVNVTVSSTHYIGTLDIS